MEHDLSRLHQELADVKRLLHQLAAAQGLAAAGAAQQEQQGAPCEQHAVEAGQLLPGLKASVQLELPHEEQPSTLKQQQQQHSLHDMLHHSLKPSISDAVMLQRAVHATHHAQAPEHDHEAHAALHALDSSQQHAADADKQDAKAASPALEHCSTAAVWDAAVHVSACAASSKQQADAEQQGWMPAQHAQSAGSWPRSAGACREVDMLAKRVHTNMEGADQQQQQQGQLLRPGSQPGAVPRCLQLALTSVRYLVWDVALPGDYQVLAWDVVMLVVILYLCIALPYTVAFAVDFTDLTNPLARIDVACSTLFLLDILMNCRVGFVGDDGKVVTSRARIISHYLRGWFIFDLVSSLPYEQIIHSHEHGLESFVALLKVPRVLRLVKMLRLLKLLRMARLTKLPALMSKVEWLLNRPMVQLGTLCAVCCLMLHVIACLWYWVATLGSDGGWVVSSGLGDSSDGHKYVSSLYFAVSTLATVGFGDIVATTLREKCVAVLVMLFCTSIFAYFMGTMSMIVQASSSTRARMASKRRAVDDFLTHRRVPRALADKVKAYYDYVVEREVQADEADIIAGMSASLRTQVILHLYQEALAKVPFFRDTHPQFITSVVTVLQLEYYAPGDIVVRQGDMGDAMYFLVQGSLEVRLYEDEDGSPLARPGYTRSPVKACKSLRPSTPIPEDEQQASQGTDGQRPSGGDHGGWLDRLRHRRAGSGDAATDAGLQRGGVEDDPQAPWCGGSRYTYQDDLANRPYRHLGYLHPGEYFGEYSCLLGQERSATVVASSYVELYSLSRADLEEVLQQWPELAEQFEAMVEEAAGGLFPEQPAASPLARWQQVKAACQQQSMHTGTCTADLQQQGPQGSSASPQQAAGGAAAAPPGLQPTGSLGQPSQVQEQQAPADQAGHGGHSRLWPLLNRQSTPSSSSRRSSFLFGGKSGSTSQTGLPFSPKARPVLTGGLPHARSLPIAINNPAAAAQSPRCADAAGPTCSFAPPEGFAAESAGAGLDPAVFDFPSLAARSVSMVSNMSGVPPGRHHRRSGSLTRGSLPPGSARASSISAGGSPVSLSRVSVPGAAGRAGFAPRQGSGLFRTNSGHRYLFPGLVQGRASVLLPSTEAEELAPVGAGLQQQASLARRSNHRMSS